MTLAVESHSQSFVRLRPLPRRPLYLGPVCHLPANPPPTHTHTPTYNSNLLIASLPLSLSRSDAHFAYFPACTSCLSSLPPHKQIGRPVRASIPPPHPRAPSNPPTSSSQQGRVDWLLFQCNEATVRCEQAGRSAGSIPGLITPALLRF